MALLYQASNPTRPNFSEDPMIEVDKHDVKAVAGRLDTGTVDLGSPTGRERLVREVLRLYAEEVLRANPFLHRAGAVVRMADGREHYLVADTALDLSIDEETDALLLQGREYRLSEAEDDMERYGPTEGGPNLSPV